MSTPTRGRGTNDPSLIDLVFTSIEDSIDNAPLGQSDHSLIKIIYRCKPVKQADKIVCNYVKADFNKMIEKLDINWDTFSRTVMMMLTLHGISLCESTTKLSENASLGKLYQQVKNASVFLLIGKR